jgi:hypothetical protein
MLRRKLSQCASDQSDSIPCVPLRNSVVEQFQLLLID